MSYCAVLRCTNYRKKCSGMPGISFHRFPHDPQRLEIWSRMIRIQRGEPYFKVNQGNTRICSAHFLDDDFFTTKSGRKKLKKTALPRLPVFDTSKVKNIRTVHKHIQTKNIGTQSEEKYFEVENLAVDTDKTANTKETLSHNKDIIDSQNEENYLEIKVTNIKTERTDYSEENHTQSEKKDSQNEEIYLNLEPLVKVKIERMGMEELENNLQIKNKDSHNEEICSDAIHQETESQEDLIDVDISDLDSIFDSPLTVALKNKIKKFEARDKMKSVKINNLQKQNARLKRKIKALKDIIEKD